jgi:hypothetical protein
VGRVYARVQHSDQHVGATPVDRPGLRSVDERHIPLLRRPVCTQRLRGVGNSGRGARNYRTGQLCPLWRRQRLGLRAVGAIGAESSPECGLGGGGDSHPDLRVVGRGRAAGGPDRSCRLRCGFLGVEEHDVAKQVAGWGTARHCGCHADDDRECRTSQGDHGCQHRDDSEEPEQHPQTSGWDRACARGKVAVTLVRGPQPVPHRGREWR